MFSLICPCGMADHMTLKQLGQGSRPTSLICMNITSTFISFTKLCQHSSNVFKITYMAVQGLSNRTNSQEGMGPIIIVIQ